MTNITMGLIAYSLFSLLLSVECFQDYHKLMPSLLAGFFLPIVFLLLFPIIVLEGIGKMFLALAKGLESVLDVMDILIEWANRK